ncbi:MAG: hypothetical protein LBS69_06195 [Prevotellaceae bacterium]|nr:hypothetical protein [Prevotellaceae bacterium]
MKTMISYTQRVGVAPQCVGIAPQCVGVSPQRVGIAPQRADFISYNFKNVITQIFLLTFCLRGRFEMTNK